MDGNDEEGASSEYPTPSHAHHIVEAHRAHLRARVRITGAEMSNIFRAYRGRLNLSYWSTADNDRVCADAMDVLEDIIVYRGCDPSLIIGYVALVREAFSHACTNLRNKQLSEDNRKGMMREQWRQIERHFAKIEAAMRDCWPLGNEPPLVSAYLSLALLYSLYKDVCREDVILRCYNAAQIARARGAFNLSTAEFTEVQQYCETIENIFFLRRQRMLNGERGSAAPSTAADRPDYGANRNVNAARTSPGEHDYRRSELPYATPARVHEGGRPRTDKVVVEDFVELSLSSDEEPAGLRLERFSLHTSSIEKIEREKQLATAQRSYFDDVQPPPLLSARKQPNVRDVEIKVIRGKENEQEEETWEMQREAEIANSFVREREAWQASLARAERKVRAEQDSLEARRVSDILNKDTTGEKERKTKHEDIENVAVSREEFRDASPSSPGKDNSIPVLPSVTTLEEKTAEPGQELPLEENAPQVEEKVGETVGFAPDTAAIEKDTEALHSFDFLEELALQADISPVSVEDVYYIEDAIDNETGGCLIDLGEVIAECAPEVLNKLELTSDLPFVEPLKPIKNDWWRAPDSAVGGENSAGPTDSAAGVWKESSTDESEDSVVTVVANEEELDKSAQERNEETVKHHQEEETSFDSYERNDNERASLEDERIEEEWKMDGEWEWKRQRKTQSPLFTTVRDSLPLPATHSSPQTSEEAPEERWNLLAKGSEMEPAESSPSAAAFQHTFSEATSSLKNFLDSKRLAGDSGSKSQLSIQRKYSPMKFESSLRSVLAKSYDSSTLSPTVDEKTDGFATTETGVDFDPKLEFERRLSLRKKAPRVAPPLDLPVIVKDTANSVSHYRRHPLTNFDEIPVLRRNVANTESEKPNFDFLLRSSSPRGAKSGH